MSQKLGKIESIDYVQDDHGFGFKICLCAPGWGCVAFLPCDVYSVSESEGKETLDRIHELMREAKVSQMSALRGKPIEARFDANKTLKSYRILTEVL